MDINNFLVHPGNSLKHVMKKICKNGNQVALIVDDNRHFLGIVTDGDIRRSIINGISIDTQISQVMNKSPIKIKNNTPIDHTINLIKNNSDKSIRHLPIVDDENKIVDLLLNQDIIKLLARSSQELFLTDQLASSQSILVTGGAGYIGSVLVQDLLENGYQVKVLDKLLFGTHHLKHLENKNLTLIQGDVGNAKDVISAIEGVDAVIHLAEIVGDPACALDPKRTQQINYISATLVARICKHFQINKFIYTSSCSVYGANNNLLTEESNLNPVSLYARMKIETEKSILDLADETFSPTILRLSTVFGKSPRMRFDLVVNVLTAKAINDGEITIFGGDQWRPFVHVKDVAKAIHTVLTSTIDKTHAQIFNVGSNENNYTITQIGQLVKQAVTSAKLIINDDDFDKRDYKVDFSKIESVLGFKASRTVMEGIVNIKKAMELGEYANYLENKFSNLKTYQSH